MHWAPITCRNPHPPPLPPSIPNVVQVVVVEREVDAADEAVGGSSGTNLETVASFLFSLSSTRFFSKRERQRMRISSSCCSAPNVHNVSCVSSEGSPRRNLNRRGSCSALYKASLKRFRSFRTFGGSSVSAADASASAVGGE